MNTLSNNYILCIETTSNICGVSVGNKNELIYKSDLDTGLNHSITLFNNITNALDSLNIDFSEINTIKVSSGPGSFTGIRIGIAAAIGLSKTYNTKIEYIDTLDSLSKIIKTNDDFLVSLIDAKVNRVYFSLYQNFPYKKLIDDQIINVFDLISLLNKYFKDKNISFAFLGNGAVNYKNIFKKELAIQYRIYNKTKDLDSESLLYTSGVISESPIINYLLASKAERDKYA